MPRRVINIHGDWFSASFRQSRRGIQFPGKMESACSCLLSLVLCNSLLFPLFFKPRFSRSAKQRLKYICLSDCVVSSTRVKGQGETRRRVYGDEKLEEIAENVQSRGVVKCIYQTLTTRVRMREICMSRAVSSTRFELYFE